MIQTVKPLVPAREQTIIEAQLHRIPTDESTLESQKSRIENSFRIMGWVEMGTFNVVSDYLQEDDFELHVKVSEALSEAGFFICSPGGSPARIAAYMAQEVCLGMKKRQWYKLAQHKALKEVMKPLYVRFSTWLGTLDGAAQKVILTYYPEALIGESQIKHYIESDVGCT